MLKSIFWLIWLFIYLLRKLPVNLRAKRLEKKGRHEESAQLVEKNVLKGARLALKHIKTNLTVEGRENLPPRDEAVVYVSNHQSYLDIPLLFVALERVQPLIAKKELRKVPLLKGWMEALGCVYLDREDARSAGKLMREVERMLLGGQSIILYPEGTRSKSDNMGEFKGGAVKMATKAKVPIVPVVLDGAYKILEGNGYRLQAADVRISFLPKIQLDGMDRDELKALPKRLEEMIREEKDKGKLLEQTNK